MGNKYIKTVAGGENTSPAGTEALLLDDGVAYKYALLTTIRTFFKTTYDALYAPIAKGVTSGDAHTHLNGDGATVILPVGQMRNGKITPTVAANDLILTLKNAAGNDPSAADPVEVNINGTMRKVTAALSVTKADATNWANLGSAELATKETDLFVYLVWNTNLTPDAVDIFWSRIPYGRLYSDFSATTTNEKYAAINATAPAATDECVNIGRFAATLSAGAGYTWTVPTYTNINLIQHPIFETRILDWVPTQTGFSSAPTGGIYHYKVTNDKCEYWIRQPTADGASNANTFTMTSPFSMKTITNMVLAFICTADDNSTSLTASPVATMASANNSITFYKDAANAVWTASNNKRCRTAYMIFEL